MLEMGPLLAPIPGAKTAGADEERRKLQVAVAMRAGERRSPRGVLLHEIRDDGVAELSLEIDDVMREADVCGHTPRVLQVVERAARAPRLFPGALVIQLHRQTNHVMTLLGEQGRGDRRVDAS